MDSPGIKKVIVVNENGMEEEVKRGIVCKFDEQSGVQNVFVGLDGDAFFEIVRDFVEVAIDVGIGGCILLLDIITQKMMEKWVEDDEDEWLQAGDRKERG